METQFQEFIQAKSILKDLQKELRGYTKEWNNYTDVKQAKYALKKLRNRHLENTKELRERIAVARETMDLKKEMLRIEMLDAGQMELFDKPTQTKVKLVNLLKEIKS